MASIQYQELTMEGVVALLKIEKEQRQARIRDLVIKDKSYRRAGPVDKTLQSRT